MDNVFYTVCLWPYPLQRTFLRPNLRPYRRLNEGKGGKEEGESYYVQLRGGHFIHRKGRTTQSHFTQLQAKFMYTMYNRVHIG